MWALFNLGNDAPGKFNDALAGRSAITCPRYWRAIPHKASWTTRLCIDKAYHSVRQNYTYNKHGLQKRRRPLRADARAVFERMRDDRVLPHIIEEGREEEFSMIYEAFSEFSDEGDDLGACAFLTKFWLESCQLRHNSSCQPSPAVDAGLPSRLVALSDRALSTDASAAPKLHGAIRVVDVNSTQSPQPQYAAVSYRWPENPCRQHQLSLATQSDLAAGVSATLFPPLYRDAFTLALLAGIQHVWIDALCIIQDHTQDWHAEASRIASIYYNATMTLAFGDGGQTTRIRHPHPSFMDAERVGAQPLDVYEHWSSCSLQVAAQASNAPVIQGDGMSTMDKRSPESRYAWLEANDNFPTRPVSQLDKRIWTFQERLFSRRILTVSAEGLFWDCCTQSASNRRPLGLRGDFSPRFRDSDEKRLKRLLTSPHLGSVPPSRSDTYMLWRRILHEYSRRDWTIPSDRLVALQGVSDRFGYALRDECYLGVWRDDAVRSLFWFCKETSLPLMDDYPIRVPSWSWASVPSPVHNQLWHPFQTSVTHDAELVTPLARFIRADMPRSHRTHHHPSPDWGYPDCLWLKAALSHVPIQQLDKTGCRVMLDSRPLDDFPYSKRNKDRRRKSSLLGTVSYTTSQWQPLLFDESGASRIHLMPLFIGGYTTVLQAQYCLILIREPGVLSDGLPMPIFRRVGIFVMDNALQPLCLTEQRACTNDVCREREGLPRARQCTRSVAVQQTVILV